jgi:hypothetical protein
MILNFSNEPKMRMQKRFGKNFNGVGKVRPTEEPRRKMSPTVRERRKRTKEEETTRCFIGSNT